MPCDTIRRLRKEFHDLSPKERTAWLHQLAATGTPPSKAS